MSDIVDAARDTAQTYLLRVRTEGQKGGWMALLSATMTAIDDYADVKAQEVRDAAEETAK